MNISKAWASVREFLAEEDGPTAVEYAVMLGAILAVCIASVTFMGSSNNQSFEESADAISGAVN